MMTQAQVDAHNAKVLAGKSKVVAGPFVGRETELHNLIIAELRQRRWYFVHSRTDRASSQNLGVPDFIIAAPGGRVYWVEVKRKGGKLSPEQVVTRHVLLALGQRYAVVYSMADFHNFCKL